MKNYGKSKFEPSRNFEYLSNPNEAWTSSEVVTKFNESMENRVSHRTARTFIQRQQRERSVTNISKGDIVILKNDSTNKVELGKVEELLTRTDGKVRAAIVKVAGSKTRPTLLRRTIQQLIPIEVNSKPVET
jgi:viroplasmin and RNaseH domain-containing protein